MNGNKCDSKEVHDPHTWRWWSGDLNIGLVTAHCPGILDIRDGVETVFCGWQLNHKPHLGTAIDELPLFHCPGYQYVKDAK